MFVLLLNRQALSVRFNKNMHILIHLLMKNATTSFIETNTEKYIPTQIFFDFEMSSLFTFGHLCQNLTILLNFYLYAKKQHDLILVIWQIKNHAILLTEDNTKTSRIFKTFLIRFKYSDFLFQAILKLSHISRQSTWRFSTGIQHKVEHANPNLIMAMLQSDQLRVTNK